ncbi:hypothetical protein J3F84DRAFT_278500 [Trichoderma pleuroticola]
MGRGDGFPTGLISFLLFSSFTTHHFLHLPPLISFFIPIEGDDYIHGCLDGYTRIAAHQGGIMRYAQRRCFVSFSFSRLGGGGTINVNRGLFFVLSFVARRFSGSLVLSLSFSTGWVFVKFSFFFAHRFLSCRSDFFFLFPFSFWS